MMGTVTFDTAFERTIGIEAGYVNSPADPGGETKWGISKRSYPDLDIKNLSRDDAKKIYLRDFWTPCAQYVHDGMQYQLFDAAFNHGMDNAIRMVQAAVRVAQDGHFGPVSKAALDATPTCKLELRFLAARLNFMTDLNKWVTFGKGWARRIATDLNYAADDL